jgi:hypothetical protein
LTGNTPTEITLPRYSPTEFTEFTEEVAESILPQISLDTDRFFQGGALVSSAPTEQEVQQQNGLVHLRQVHPLESSICENLCNLWENILQEGSVYSVNSVGEHTARRVNSVGEHTARRFCVFREFRGRTYTQQKIEIIIKKQNRNMILDIENILVSSDIITEQFCCDLDACKGICCVEGDAGAPVTLEEIGGIEDALDTVWGDMSAQAQAVVDKQGVAYTDRDGDLVTSIVGGKDCVFTCYEGDCCLCALERAHRAGKTSFIKPISCALYPIREKRFANGTVALNYNRWDVCKDAVKKGRELQLPVYKFLEGPLTRRFGKEWYAALCEVAEHFDELCE